jgi:hypothetical protein
MIKIDCRGLLYVVCYELHSIFEKVYRGVHNLFSSITMQP